MKDIQSLCNIDGLCNVDDTLQDLRTAGYWYNPQLGHFPDRYSDGVHSPLIVNHYFNDGQVESSQ